jgi:heptosyltransferase-2
MAASVAILKPDHIGDLVLAAPAIRALNDHFDNVTLFVGSSTLGLARYLFPEIEDCRALDFPHLARRPVEAIDGDRLVRQLARYDLVVCLRHDPVIETLLEDRRAPWEMTPGGWASHDTALHKAVVGRLVGPYSRTRLLSGPPILWPMRELRHVGLSVAAGFPTNRWPLSLWLDLAIALHRQAIALTLIGGPLESGDLDLLSGLMTEIPHRVVRGGEDIGQFLADISDMDVVVATDGGTAHLASLKKPVCALFGSSPWRRYAPFGRNNILLTRDEPCSPCLQFSASEVNGCLTRECMASLSVRQVLRVLRSNGIDFSHIGGVRVERGVSHAYDGTRH